jgi:hypothetical protein
LRAVSRISARVASISSEPIEAATKWLVLEFIRNQGLLRAQIRGALDRLEEWQPLQQIGREPVESAIRIIQQLPDVQQEDGWQRRVRLATQMIPGTLNNFVINRPDPLELTDNATADELSRAAIRYGLSAGDGVRLRAT